MVKHSSHSSQEIITPELADGQFSIRRNKVPSGVTSRRAKSSAISPDDLLTWVSTTRSAGAARINEILELIVELVNLGRGDGDAKTHLLAWQGRVIEVRANLGKKKSKREVQIAEKLNYKLRRYKLSPWYWTTIGDYPVIGWWSGENRPRDDEDPTEDVWFTEQDAVNTILDLARNGLFSRIRCCRYCRDWFLGKFVHQRFCQVSCQQRFYRSSDEYKADRRAYMKKLRAQHKKTYFVGPHDRADKRKEGSGQVRTVSRFTKPKGNTSRGQNTSHNRARLVNNLGGENTSQVGRKDLL